MTTELGKSGYEGEKDIAAQKEIYAAFLELMMELLKNIPGLIPRIDGLNPNGINIQKYQGLTIERKPKGEGIVEIEQKQNPKTTQSEQANKSGVETLYGNGQNNLTSNDIKAISAIIAGKQGDTVIGGEGLIVKFNGKTLFETDERGKISLHTAVSPEIQQRFAALQAGRQNPTPATTLNNAVSPAPKSQQPVSQSKVQDQIGNIFVSLMNSLPAIGVPKIPEEKPASTIITPHPANNIILPPNFKTEEKRDSIVEDPLESLPPLKAESSLIEAELSPVEAEVEVEETPLHQAEQPDVEVSEAFEDVQVEPVSPVIEVEEKIVDEAEILSQPDQSNPTESVVAPKKSILSNVGSYISDRAKKDTQVVVDAMKQQASDVVSNLPQGLPSITDAITDQYRVFKTRLTNAVVPENDLNSSASINRYIDQVVGMFDELEQDDPNLGLSARYIANETYEQEVLEPSQDNSIELVAEKIDESEQVDRSLDDTTKKVRQPELPSIEKPKPSKLKTVSVEDALSYMRSRDDGAKAQDGKGYNLNDTGIGKKLITQIDRGEVLDSVQAKDALVMLRKYSKQFTEGNIKLPTWKSVQAQYLPPVVITPDKGVIFIGQQKEFDVAQSAQEDENILKTAFKVFTLNMPEQSDPTIQPGKYEIELPTGAKFINEIDDLGINTLSINRAGNNIVLGHVASAKNSTTHVPALTIGFAMSELRELKPYLSSDLKINPEPVNAILLTQSLPMDKNDASKSIDDMETPFTLQLEEEPYSIKPGQEPAAQEKIKTPAISRGGR